MTPTTTPTMTPTTPPTTMQPTTTPTTTPTEAPVPVFSVTSGLCTVSEDGRCFQSPNYPDDYPNGRDGNCMIRVSSEVALDVKFFETERSYDILRVNNINFSGFKRPDGVSFGPISEIVPAGGMISFVPD
eukprot:5184589-Pyramimonas_sp.AAC.1